jgi:hypothetical protein
MVIVNPDLLGQAAPVAGQPRLGAQCHAASYCACDDIDVVRAKWSRLRQSRNPEEKIWTLFVVRSSWLLSQCE